MGCDIHGFIEYNRYKDFWDCFAKLFLVRNYTMFGALAGVRETLPGFIEPKGLPQNTSYRVKEENEIFVQEDGDNLDEANVNRSTANGLKKICPKIYEGKNFVTNPDHHSHSWLDLDELKNAYYLYNDQLKKESPEVKTFTLETIISTMESLEKSGYKTRFTFWFDN